MFRYLRKHYLVGHSDWVKNKDGSCGIWRFYIFFCSLFSIRLNLVWEDEPNTFHNHNWNAWSLILLGGYKETVFDKSGKVAKVLTRRFGSLRFQPAAQFHRTDYLDKERPALTFYIAGRRFRNDEWYKLDGKNIDWKTENIKGR